MSSTGTVSMGSKRRRATSPSSSASGGDFDDATSSTPVSGWKRRRASSTAPSVDQVSAWGSNYLLWHTVQITTLILSVFLLCFIFRLLCAMNCTTLSEITKTIKADRSASSLFVYQRGGTSIFFVFECTLPVKCLDTPMFFF